MIFLVTIVITTAATFAANNESSNLTLSSDDNSPNIPTTTNVTKVTTKEKSNFESDNISKQSEKVESTNTITKTNKTTINKTVKQAKPQVGISLSPVKTKNNQTITINAQITTNQNAVNGQTAVLKVNGITKSKTTINNGVITFRLEIPNWSSKDYKLSVKVGATDTTEETEVKSTLTIIKRNITIANPGVEIHPNSQVRVYTTIKDQDGNLINGNVAVVKINGKTVIKTRVVNGIIDSKFTTTIPPSYKLEIKVGENSYYNGQSRSTNVNLVINTTTTTSLIVFSKKNSKVTLHANVLDSKGNKINAGKVAFKVNGKTVGIVQVSNGVAQYIYNNKDLSKTINNITIVYSGTKNYVASNTTSTLRVQTKLSKYTYNDILKKANDTKSFIEKNGRLPNFITIGNDQVSTADFLYLLCQVYDQNKSFSIGEFTQKTESKTNCVNEQIQKADYILMAHQIVKCYVLNGRAPLVIKHDNLKLSFEDTLYFYTRSVAFIYNNDMMSLYGTVLKIKPSGDNGIFNLVPDGMEKYVQKTNHCEVNSSAIRSKTLSIISGVTGVYNQAVSIFNYVRSKISYSGYYNTRYGASGTLSRGYGNCCDQASLTIAMMRTIGIPARYNHAKCYFSSGLVTGHVWAEVYVGGKWYRCDPTSNRNSFGVIKNWYKYSGNLKYYTEIPF